MKISQLRNIIQEEVRKAIREELADILTEAVEIASRPKEVKELDYKWSTPAKKQVSEKQEFTPKWNPIEKKAPTFNTGNKMLDEMLGQTAKTAPTSDLRAMSNPGNNMASSMAHQMVAENQGPQPGIDISKLGFVNKAKAVLDASYEKDASRHGL